LEFEEINISNRYEDINMPNTPKQRRELEDLIYKDKGLNSYSRMLAKCSEILGRNISGVGMMYRSEIARCLRELKREKS